MGGMQYTRNHSLSAHEGLALASMCSVDFLHGVVETTVEADGWVRPERFSSLQRRALSSCLAWHPGLYRQMASTTAGVCVRFFTDATEVALAVRLDAEPAATVATLRGAEGEYDGVSVVVDGACRGIAAPVHGIVRVPLEGAPKSTDAGFGMMALPGLGKRHEVCLWLPCLRGCTIRELWADGTYVEPVNHDRRILVIGDEMGQGYCCGDPALSWPARIASSWGLELINQSVAGQVFQPSSILDARVDDVDVVVVELGSNYTNERCDLRMAAVDARAFFSEVARHWPEALVCAVVPDWMAQTAAFIVRAARACGAQTIDGARLVRGGTSVLPSGAEVLDAQGNEQLAEGLLKALEPMLGVDAHGSVA